MRPPAVTRCSCIACSSAACVFGGVRLISSASTMFAKIGPLHEAELAAPGRSVLLENVGAGDVRRHQVGRELNAVERQVQHVGERRDQQRLRQARHADEQAVPAREERDQQLLDDLALADDPPLDLAENVGARLGERLDCLEVVAAGVLTCGVFNESKPQWGKFCSLASRYAPRRCHGPLACWWPRCPVSAACGNRDDRQRSARGRRRVLRCLSTGDGCVRLDVTPHMGWP